MKKVMGIFMATVMAFSFASSAFADTAKVSAVVVFDNFISNSKYSNVRLKLAENDIALLKAKNAVGSAIANETSTSSADMATQVLQYVNEERAVYGLSPLVLNSDLTQTAQLKADDMAENDYFSHISPNYGTAFDMLKSEHISYGCAAENLASGQHTAAEVVDNWMHSDGHRANILSSELKELGVGFATQNDGTTYWVQMFIG